VAMASHRVALSDNASLIATFSSYTAYFAAGLAGNGFCLNSLHNLPSLSIFTAIVNLCTWVLLLS